MTYNPEILIGTITGDKVTITILEPYGRASSERLDVKEGSIEDLWNLSYYPKEHHA